MNRVANLAACAALLALPLGGCVSVERVEVEEKTVATPLGKIRHVVLFAFKPGTTVDELRAIEGGMMRLPREIDLVRGFEWGADITANERAEGYTHCMAMLFDSQADVATYRDHPKHQEFVKLAMPHVAKVLVIDYHIAI